MTIFGRGFYAAQRALQALDIAERVIEMSEQEEKRTLIEEIELEGRQIIDRIKELIREGNVRRLIIKDAEGKFLLEVPLTAGVVAGGAFALAAPGVTALMALVGLVMKVRVQIVREVQDTGDVKDDQPEGGEG